jgi:hypothetical protein
VKFLSLYYVRGTSSTGYRWESPARYKTKEGAQQEIDVRRKDSDDSMKVMTETFRLYEHEQAIPYDASKVRNLCSR